MLGRGWSTHPHHERLTQIVLDHRAELVCKIPARNGGEGGNASTLVGVERAYPSTPAAALRQSSGQSSSSCTTLRKSITGSAYCWKPCCSSCAIRTTAQPMEARPVETRRQERWGDTCWFVLTPWMTPVMASRTASRSLWMFSITSKSA